LLKRIRGEEEEISTFPVEIEDNIFSIPENNQIIALR
jgi:hypothetical protein